MTKDTLTQLVRDMGTVRMVAQRRTNPDGDHRAMLTRLEEWQATLHRVLDEFDAAHTAPQPPAGEELNVPVWKCRLCGCLWRDNLDETVSLLDANQKSCDQCEFDTTPTSCDIHWLKMVRAASVSGEPAQPPAAEAPDLSSWNMCLSGLEMEIQRLEQINALLSEQLKAERMRPTRT